MVSVATTTMGQVTENASPHPHHVVQKPRKRTTPVEVADFTMLVKVPGQPEAIRAFTADEADEARKYAADTGGTVVPLPLPPPDGYTTDDAGNLIPLPPPTCAGMADGPQPEPGDVTG